MASNFRERYLTALSDVIVAEGGSVPSEAWPNFQEANIAYLDELVDAVGGSAPALTINYQEAAIARWRSAITAKGGVLPLGWLNYWQATVDHIAALQEARLIDTTAILATPAPTNAYEKIIALLEATP